MSLTQGAPPPRSASMWMGTIRFPRCLYFSAVSDSADATSTGLSPMVGFREVLAKRLSRTSAAAGTAALPTACDVVVSRTSLSHATAADTSTATLKARGAPWPIAP